MLNRFSAEEVLRESTGGQQPKQGETLVFGSSGWVFGSASLLGAATAFHASSHYADGNDPIDIDRLDGRLNANKLDGSATLSSLETSGSVDVGGTLQANGNLVAGGTIYSGITGIGFSALLSGNPPMFGIPALSTVCVNLDSDKVDGMHSNDLLAFANAIGTLTKAQQHLSTAYVDASNQTFLQPQFIKPANLVMVRMWDSRMTVDARGWDIRMGTGGIFELRAVTDAGSNLAVAFTLTRVGLAQFLHGAEVTGGNLSLFATGPAFNSGNGVVFVANRTTAPTAAPSGGFYMSSASGIPTFRTSSNKIINLDQSSAITAPTGGSVIDVESRTAINQLIAAGQARGLLA